MNGNSTDLMEQALMLASAGLAVFPLRPKSKVPLTSHGFKDASTDEAQIRFWWTECPDANIGIATGKASGGLLVIDVDVDSASGKNGMVTLGAWCNEHGGLAETISATTGRGGVHFYYRCAKPYVNTANSAKSVDIRAEGGYVVAPPSIHENGNEYCWNIPFDADMIAEADENTLAFVDSLYPEKRSVNKRGVPTNVGNGSRNNALISYVGRLQQMGASDETIYEYADEFNQTRMSEPLGGVELAKTVESGLGYEKGPAFGAPGSPFKGIEMVPRNEKEWSRVFAKWLHAKACFVPEEKSWRYWDGKHWVKDGDAQRINRLCKLFVDELVIYAQTCAGIPEEVRASFVDFVNKYNKLNERKRLIEDTKCEVTVQRARFDSNTDLLNLKNGVLNLKTLEFREGHDPADLCGKVANVEYDPAATCEEWERFLKQSLVGDEDTIGFLQVALALGLTCDTSTECFFILLGPTRSGKSTTVETVQTMLNPEDDGYACSSDPETFAVKRFDDASRPKPDVARLAGKRFVVTSEPPKNMLFNVAQLKNLTGRDMVTARFLNENDFQFYPQFTLMMTANNAPRINDMTLFESDRVHVIPFDNHLEADQRDLGLKGRLTEPESLSGILNWCIAGLQRYRKEGLKPSAASVMATINYRAESDKIHAFMVDCLASSEGDYATGTSVYTAYQHWCNESGYQAEGKQAFFRELRERQLLLDSCTVQGVTKRNVVPNCRIFAAVHG